MRQVISLSKTRKAKAKVLKADQAAENAAKFGRSKAQNLAEAKDAARAKKYLDQHERQGDDG
jgi:hypothetical protein